jgi:hypothetical protein
MQSKLSNSSAMATLVDMPTSNLTTAFKYISLQDPRLFRLVRFKGGADTSEQLHCTIEEFERGGSQCPPYMALSYVWGDANSKALIKINEQLVSVTANLYEALLHMRRLFPNLYLWVDALSINQGDTGERNHQVSQMRAIYSEAQQVVAWLGPKHGLVERLFSYATSHTHGEASKNGLQNECAIFADQELADALEYLLLRPYWSRIWIIQEVVVATDLILMCGELFIEWPMFKKFLYLEGGLLEWPPSVEENCVRLRKSASNILRLAAWSQDGLDLEHVLNLSEASLASDPRDKVYAVLGLVGRGAGRRIVVDYTQSACAVYCVAIQAIVEDWNVFAETTLQRRLATLLHQMSNAPHLSDQMRQKPPGCLNVVRLRKHILFVLEHARLSDDPVEALHFDDFSSNPPCDGRMCGSLTAMGDAAINNF